MPDAARTDAAGERRTLPLYPKLRPGPGLSREEVAENQRARIQGAMVELADERGYDAVTVRDLAQAAGVSKASFYALFSDKEDCFLATSEVAIGSVRRRVAGGQEVRDPAGRIRAGLLALAGWLAEEPKAARLVLIETPQVGTRALERMDEEMSCFESCLADCLTMAGDPAPPALLVKGIAAGISHAARAQLLEGRPGAFAEHCDELLRWMLSFHGMTDLERIGVEEKTEAEIVVASQRRDQRSDTATLERDRLLAAAVAIAARQGFAALTPPRVRAAAHASRRSFDANFDDIGDCFLAAIAYRADPLLSSAALAFERATDWTTGVRRVIASVLDALARDPTLARLGFLDLPGAGPAALAWRQDLIDALAERFRACCPPESRPGRLAAESSVAACWELVHQRVRADQSAELSRGGGTVVLLMLAPVLGPPGAIDGILAAATSTRPKPGRSPSASASGGR